MLPNTTAIARATEREEDWPRIQNLREDDDGGPNRTDAPQRWQLRFINS
jgi:hypothetical protein